VLCVCADTLYIVLMGIVPLLIIIAVVVILIVVMYR